MTPRANNATGESGSVTAGPPGLGSAGPSPVENDGQQMQPEPEASPQKECSGAHTFASSPCGFFDIYEARADAEVQTDWENVLRKCEATSCPKSASGNTTAHTVFFSVLPNEEQHRVEVDRVREEGEWELLPKSSQGLKVGDVIGVFKPVLSSDGGKICVQLPRGLVGIVSTVDDDGDCYAFFPDLLDVHNCHPWRWLDKETYGCLSVGRLPATCDVPAAVVQSKPATGHRPKEQGTSQRAQMKDRQLARRAAKVMM